MFNTKRAFAGAGAVIALLLVTHSMQAAPIELLTNGGFETGTFAGWTVVDQAGGSGSFFISAPGTATPLSGFPTAANPMGGSFYAVSDQFGPGTHSLLQTFTVPGPGTVILSFQMFVNDQSGSGGIVNPVGLDFTDGPNQHGRVDILSALAGPFDTGAGVLGNFYLGVDPGPNPNPYVTYMFDITSLVGAGGTFQLRFAEVDNQFFFNLGVDNVSILFEPIPEPTTLALCGLIGVGLAGYGWRRRNARAA